MKNIVELSRQNQRDAWKLLEKTDIIQLWENIGATVNFVGSFKSALMMKSRDIDIHVYTDKVTIADSFSVIAKLAENPSVKEIQYVNLIDTEEECIEWHISMEDNKKNQWKFDIIHIRRGSKYDGFVESVTDAIMTRLTPETKEAILRIKYDMPDDIKIPGIEIYRAVLSGGVRGYEEFLVWREQNPLRNSMEWIP
jgi:hypothetical protein